MLVGPVYPMGVCAVGVVSNPARFDSARVKFRAGPRVDPDSLPPFGDTGEIGFFAVELLVGCGAVA